MYRWDVAAGASFISIGIAMGICTFWFPETTEKLGPAFMPRIIAIMLLTLGILVMWQTRKAVLLDVSVVGLSRDFLVRSGSIIGCLMLYLLLLSRLPALGFPLLTPLLLFSVGIIFGGRFNFPLVLTSILIAEFVYAFFRLWLGLPLPRSAWF